ncbi:MAG TPA: TlpA disulfide reductase family protein [Motiliproteus sp.]
MTPGAFANHETNEPSDGTVNSFIELDPPQPVVPVRLVRNGRDAIDLSAFKGKLILLNIWATWCPPCIRELPALDRLQQRMGGDRFEVVAVAVDRAGIAAARSFYQQQDIQHMQLYTSTAEEFGLAFPLDVFPASFFIDAEGKVLSYMRSFADWDDPRADAKINGYLANP